MRETTLFKRSGKPHLRYYSGGPVMEVPTAIQKASWLVPANVHQADRSAKFATETGRAAAVLLSAFQPILSPPRQTAVDGADPSG